MSENDIIDIKIKIEEGNIFFIFYLLCKCQKNFIRIFDPLMGGNITNIKSGASAMDHFGWL